MIRNMICLAVVLVIGGLLIATARRAMGQEHGGHPPQDMEIHDKFYSTWFMPDNPSRSCCNKADCYPVEHIEWRGDELYAMRREDRMMIRVPQQKIERNRDNPDGRNHMCAPPPWATSYPVGTVFCFSLGGGI